MVQNQAEIHFQSYYTKSNTLYNTKKDLQLEVISFWLDLLHLLVVVQ